MSERKVLNKYFPPDFDPSKIQSNRAPKAPKKVVRLMTPFSMRCDTCGEFIYKSKKFNAQKEKAKGEDYLGIQIYRFHIKCPVCYANITFKTDPKNMDYVAESGAQRNFEPWREEKFVAADLLKAKEEEEQKNPMKALENKTFDSKREMEILDMLDEIKTKNARTESVDADAVLKAIQEERVVAKRKIELEDEEYARAVFNSSDGVTVKRLLDQDEEELEAHLKAEKDAIISSALSGPSSSATTHHSLAKPVFSSKKPDALSKSLGIVVKKRAIQDTAKPQPSALTLLGGAYSDSD